MSSHVKKAIIENLQKISQFGSGVLSDADRHSFALILSDNDYQQFKAGHDDRLHELKKELDGILALVQSHTERRSLQDVEKQLAILQKTLEQELINLKENSG